MIRVGVVMDDHWGSYICVIQKRAVGDSHTMIIVGTVREEHWGSYICVIQKEGVCDRVIP